jgi:hypothetical protein
MRARLVLVGLLAGCGFSIPGTTGDGVSSDARGDDGTADSSADAEIDAARDCPMTYTATYRREAIVRTWLDAEKTCEADAPGITHLVVIDDDAERVAIATLVAGLPGDAWVGIVRDPGGVAPWPWRKVTGGAAIYAPFESTEPNNMSGDQYTVVMRQSSQLLYDYGVGQLVYAVCECDGRPPSNADYDPATTN